LSLAESADWKTALNRKQCDWRRYADSNSTLVLGKLKFGFFHGLSEVEGRSELRMFNRLFFEAQFINSPAVSFSDFSKVATEQR
jgi:hypothetical protein